MGSTMTKGRTAPSKRARDEGASLAPAPELAAASWSHVTERRVRRRTTRSTAAPGQDAATSATAGSQIRLPGSRPFTRSAAASQRAAPALPPVPERFPAMGRCPSCGSAMFHACKCPWPRVVTNQRTMPVALLGASSLSIMR